MNIWDLFRGYEHAHGRYEIKSKNERGKAEGRALTIREPVTEELWRSHMDGSGPGLGVIPLLEDDTVVWGCIDIDQYPLDHKQIVGKIEALGLPLVVCRSKSGGAHLFLFLTEPVGAEAVQDALTAWAAALGHGGCEVFPKQISRYNEQDLGNWLNMPFYALPRSLRYGFDAEGNDLLDVGPFMEYAQTRLVTPERLEAITVDAPTTKSGKKASPVLPPNDGVFVDGPPCLQILHAQGGFPEGTRNDGLYNVAVYLRKRFPDDWKDKLPQYNGEVCDPPLGLSEINAVAKSVDRKDYGFKCKHAPINSYCNRKACLGRLHGVGEGGTDGDRLDIGAVTKYMGDPVLWFLDVSGQRLMVTTEELLSQAKFQARVMETLNRCLSPMPQARWAKYLDGKIRNCEEVEVPEDASPTGQFHMLVRQYITGTAQATSKEELLHRFTPYRTGSGEVWFRSRGLLEYLTHHNYKYRSEHHVWQMLRVIGADNKFLNVKGHGFNVWAIPDPGEVKDDEELPDFGGREF